MKKMLLILTIMLMIATTSVYAGAVDTFDQIDIKKSDKISGVTEKGLGLLGTLQWIGYLVAIGMVIWVGIRYLISGAGEKAKAKEMLVPVVIGAVLVAGATWIASTLFGALQ